MPWCGSPGNPELTTLLWQSKRMGWGSLGAGAVTGILALPFDSCGDPLESRLQSQVGHSPLSLQTGRSVFITLTVTTHCLNSQLGWCGLSCAHWQHIPVPSLPGWQNTQPPDPSQPLGQQGTLWKLLKGKRRRRRSRRALPSMVIPELLLSLRADL